MADEEMAEGGQVDGLKGGGPRKGGGGGWLALLICKTANLRTLCLPALSSSFSTFSLPPPSLPTVDLLALSHLPSLSLAFSSSISLSLSLYSLSPFPFRLNLSSFLARISRPLQTRTPIYIVTLSLLSVPFRLTCLRSLIPAVRPVSSTYLL